MWQDVWVKNGLLSGESEPVEIGVAVYARCLGGIIEQGKAVGGPYQSQAHVEHVADGMEGAAVGAVKEAGSEVQVSGARPDPQ